MTKSKLNVSSGWQSLLLHSSPGVPLVATAQSITTNAQLIEPALRTKASTIPQISVETIRDLRRDVQTSHNHDVIIKQADTMTPQAQNAFLKILEEPNQYTRFVLLTNHPDRLLPTIRSRVESVYVPLASKQDSELLLSRHKVFDERTRAQLLYLAEGRLEELEKLATDEKYRENKFLQARIVRELLHADPYGRLASIANLNLQRTAALELIELIQSILGRQPNLANLKLSERLDDAYAAISGYGNVKLQLTRAMVY